MAAEVKLGDIIEALEMATDESFSYLDREKGEVHFIRSTSGAWRTKRRPTLRLCRNGSGN